MSALAIRIIGGVIGGAIGTFISDKIYKYMYIKSKESYPAKQIDNTLQKAKSFEEILNIEFNKQSNNNVYQEDGNKIKDINLNIDIDIENDNKNEKIFINDALYDNNYIDYYSLYFGHEKKNNIE